MVQVVEKKCRGSQFVVEAFFPMNGVASGRSIASHSSSSSLLVADSSSSQLSQFVAYTSLLIVGLVLVAVAFFSRKFRSNVEFSSGRKTGGIQTIIVGGKAKDSRGSTTLVDDEEIALMQVNLGIRSRIGAYEATRALLRSIEPPADRQPEVLVEPNSPSPVSDVLCPSLTKLAIYSSSRPLDASIRTSLKWPSACPYAEPLPLAPPAATAAALHYPPSAADDLVDRFLRDSVQFASLPPPLLDSFQDD